MAVAVAAAGAGCADDGEGGTDAAPDAADTAGLETGDTPVPDSDGPAGPTIEYHSDLDLDLWGPGGVGDRADVADPTVIKVDDTWFLYGTRTEVDLEVWSSVDLAHWEYGGPVWAPTPGSWNDHGSIWAPHVEPTDDGYYLYYTANGAIGVARAGSPTGPFEDLYDHPFIGGGYGGVGDGVYASEGYTVTDPLHFLTDAEEYAIDAFVLRASDGSLTFYCSVLTPASVIAAVPMVDYDTLADVPPEIVLDLDSDVVWESLNREGPWVVEHEGSFHLMYSAAFWWTDQYAVGVATGPTPFGPFERRPDNPFLRATPDGTRRGPGHHSVVEGAFDDLLLFYHSKVASEDYAPRRARYVAVGFDASGALELR